MVSSLKTFTYKGWKIAANFAILSKKLFFFRVLGEKWWEDVVSAFKTFAHKGCKRAAPIFLKFYFMNFALLAGFFCYRCYYLHRSRDALSPICGISGPILSINQNVCMCICLSVCLSVTLSHSPYWYFCPHFQNSNVQTFVDFGILGKE